MQAAGPRDIVTSRRGQLSHGTALALVLGVLGWVRTHTHSHKQTIHTHYQISVK